MHERSPAKRSIFRPSVVAYFYLWWTGPTRTLPGPSPTCWRGSSPSIANCSLFFVGKECVLPFGNSVVCQRAGEILRQTRVGHCASDKYRRQAQGCMCGQNPLSFPLDLPPPPAALTAVSILNHADFCSGFLGKFEPRAWKYARFLIYSSGSIWFPAWSQNLARFRMDTR